MGKIAFVFPGQGAQYPGMGQTLMESSAGKAVFETAESLRPGTMKQCFEGTGEELKITENTQPCIFAVSLAAASALYELGVRPEAAAGFSLGEVTALTFAGRFDNATGFSLVTKRGRLMQKAAEDNPGKMAAVLKLPKEEVERLCSEHPGVWPVNYNSPGQIAVAGKEQALPDFCAAVKASGGRATILAVGGAFHSPLMEEAANAFYGLVVETKTAPVRMPVFANATAAPYTGDTAGLLSKQIMSPVLWQQTIERMIKEGFDTFVETGPGKVLSGLIARIEPSARCFQCDGFEQAKTAAEEILNRGGASC
jgi:[acyl-carrier-protein] S-malonyltransferase